MYKLRAIFWTDFEAVKGRLINTVEVTWRKTKHAFSVFYSLIKHGFLTNQSPDRVLFTIIKQ